MSIGEELVFAGDGVAVARLRLQVARIAPHFRLALLVGERGTGVETVARRMHALSPSASDAFVILRVEELLAGTRAAGVVLVTGLESTHQAAQGVLLRHLQGLARETRVLVAIECDPRGMVATGRLRADLFERIGMLEIRVAPLRERLAELPALLGAGVDFSEAAMARMKRYGWPGNLAELSDLKARVARLGRVVEEADLGLAEEEAERVVRLDEVIERHVVTVLERVGGNKLRAAELLGISRSTLYRMLEGVGV